LNRTATNQPSLNQPSIERNTYSRRVAKIQERFNALPLDVQQEIMRLREPDARTTQAPLSMTSKENHSEAA
jgi:hypothetical protein